MKKQFMIGYVAGAVTFGAIGALAAGIIANPNPFPIQLNGSEVSIEGYNIDGSTYFKLRDIANIVGGFEVDFNNDTIQLSKDGYVYDNAEIVAYYPGSDFAPDYSAYFQVDSIEDVGINAYGLYYQTNCVSHLYEYDIEKVLEYEDLLADIGFEKVYSEHSMNLYEKNNNYVMVSWGKSFGVSIDVYPINDPDYKILLDSEYLGQKMDEYKDAIPGDWVSNDGRLLTLAKNSSAAYFSSAPLNSTGTYEIYGTNLSCCFTTPDGSNAYYKFKYTPNSDQIVSLDDNSVYTQNNANIISLTDIDNVDKIYGLSDFIINRLNELL